MPYHLGRTSLANLNGVEPRLVALVKRAIEITDQDFTVYEGVRTLERQRQYVTKGVSQTMNSQHLIHADNYGHAVDLVPWIDGSARWEWPPIYHIATAMCRACKEQSVLITWGGVWNRRLNSLDCVPSRLEAAVRQYCADHAGPDFIDGPHYELA